jgi:hypothetical protein
MAKSSVKIVKLDINEEDEFSGVDAIALVESPAIEAGWMFFNKQEIFESYSDYPDAVSNNAQKGIDLNEKQDNKCATQVGKVRAQQLAKGEAVSVETIKRMYSYLSRAEEYYDESDTTACGTISYLLWGGLAGKRWAESKLKELGLFEGAVDVSELPDYVNEASGSIVEKFVTPSAGESEDDFISRCIPVVIGEGKDGDQAAAICYSYWRDRFENDKENERVLYSYVSGLFDLLAFLDGIPVFATPAEAEEIAQVAGCEGYHEHTLGDFVVYMPCYEHEEAMDLLLQDMFEEWQMSKRKSWKDLSEDQLEDVLDYLDSVAQDDVLLSQETFANRVNTSGIKAGGEKDASFLDTPTTRVRYQYDVRAGKGSRVQSNTRDFCRVLIDRYTRRGKVFRKEDINNMSMAGVNEGFGPDGINQYDIFNYVGGNNCRHEWVAVSYSLVDGKWVDSSKVVGQSAERQNTGDVDTESLLGRLLGPNAIGTQFSKQEFAEKQIVAGPLMIPDKLIYRYDEMNGEYFVYFSEDTIEKIAYKYMQRKYTDNTNLEHSEELALSDVFVVESWIVSDPSRDKSLIYSNGEKYPKGTWYGMVKVKNKEVWDDYVKTGLVKGFSVEGFFIDELLNRTEKDSFQ